jgi:RHS repeat-associated protein
MSAIESAQQAARLTDPVGHGYGMLGMIGGAILGAVAAGLLIAGGVVTGGALIAVVVAGCVAGGGLAGGQLLNGIQRAGGLDKPITGNIANGSSNVFIGGLAAARAEIDFVGECNGRPMNHTTKDKVLIAEGSSTVMINFKPAARVTNRLVCGAEILQGIESVYIGGPNSVNKDMPIEDNEELLKTGLMVLGGAALIGGGVLAAMAGGAAAVALYIGRVAVGVAVDQVKSTLLGWVGDRIGPGWAEILEGATGLLSLGLGGGKGLMNRLRSRGSRPQLRQPPAGKLPQSRCCSVGDPVDAASGRVFSSRTDFELPGRIAIQFTRTYDTSAVDYEGPLGHGWMHPYDIHLWEDDEQQMVILRNEEGLLAGFDLIEVRERVLNPLYQQWLERLGEKVYVVRDQDGLRYRFESVEGRDEGRSEATALRLTGIEDRNGNRIVLSYENGHLNSLQDGAGTRLNFSYITLDNGAERLAAVNLVLDKEASRTARLVNFTYDEEGRLRNATDRGLVPWRYEYDGRLLIRSTNRNGLSFRFAYEGKGMGARCVHAWGDRGIYERWLEYDRETGMTVVEDSLGRKTTYHFNELDLPIGIVDALGGEKRYTYGPNGELLSETDEIGRSTKYEYNEGLDCISITNPAGTVRRFSYAADSLPQALIDESGAEFRREYDERGNITATIDALGNRRRYSYNEFGELGKAVDPSGEETKFRWNERGQITELTTPLGAATRYGYDERGRLEWISNPLGHETRYAYDAQDRLVQVECPDGTKHRYGYDPEGNLTSFIDANGAQTRFRYVDYNELGERIDALGYTRRYVYDTEANLVELRNERGEAYRFDYDALDRVIREIGFDGLRCDYAYDPAGQLIARTDPAGRITSFIRDLQGRVIERARPDGTAINFAYDRAGRMIEADAPGSELEFKYDALGRMIWESQNGQIIEHEYDALGRRIKRRSPSGQTVEFTYDPDSRMSRLQTPRGSMEFEYDKAGRIAKWRMPGELEERFYYDLCGRVIEQQLAKQSQTLTLRGYKYDAEGNLIELSDSNKGTSRFAYDPIERLQEVLQPEKKIERFVYDSTGNLLRRGEREFRYSHPDRLIQTDGTELLYDEVGNLIEKRRVESVIRYSYDPDNRLIAVESRDGGRVEFAYDAFGRRIAKKTKDGETGFLWDGDVLLSEDRGEKANEYIFELGSFAPLCRFDEGGIEVYHNDHIGTPRDITDESGQVVWSASYDVYGRIDNLRAIGRENNIRFQGQYEDTETGLRYNRFRYYDSDCARYISQDPIGILGGVNHYGYVVCPINWIDPLGQSGQSCAKDLRQKLHKDPMVIKLTGKGPKPPDMKDGMRFKLSPKEQAFADAVRQKHPNLQIYRAPDGKNLGDFIIVDASNPKKPVAIALELKSRTNSKQAGTQLKNAGSFLEGKGVDSNNIKIVTANEEEFLDMYGSGKFD